jgi:hypothetical protein
MTRRAAPTAAIDFAGRGSVGALVNVRRASKS